jgi:hypothetical protein
MSTSHNDETAVAAPRQTADEAVYVTTSFKLAPAQRSGGGAAAAVPRPSVAGPPPPPTVPAASATPVVVQRHRKLVLTAAGKRRSVFCSSAEAAGQSRPPVATAVGSGGLVEGGGPSPVVIGTEQQLPTLRATSGLQRLTADNYVGYVQSRVNTRSRVGRQRVMTQAVGRDGKLYKATGSEAAASGLPVVSKAQGLTQWYVRSGRQSVEPAVRELQDDFYRQQRANQKLRRSGQLSFALHTYHLTADSGGPGARASGGRVAAGGGRVAAGGGREAAGAAPRSDHRPPHESRHSRAAAESTPSHREEASLRRPRSDDRRERRPSDLTTSAGLRLRGLPMAATAPTCTLVLGPPPPARRQCHSSHHHRSESSWSPPVGHEQQRGVVAGRRGPLPPSGRRSPPGTPPRLPQTRPEF